MKRTGVVLCALLILSCGWVRADELQDARASGPAAPASSPAAEVTLAPDVLQSYVGLYNGDRGSLLRVDVLETGLVAHVVGQPHVAFVASEKDRFFSKTGDAQLSFQRNAAGIVNLVTLRQNGQTMTFFRVAR